MGDAQDLTELLSRRSEGTRLPPMVRTLNDRLPFQNLHWPEFERLCKRLLDQRPGLERAHAYGVPGDEQGGIDLYARRVESDQYVVVQAKKVTSFTSTKVKSAVDRFLGLDGKGRPRKGARQAPWDERADTFILAVTVSLNGQRIDEAWRVQETRLAIRGIKAERWGTEDLDDLLRNKPEIVYEFFGQEWVEVFCTNAQEWLKTFHSLAQAASETQVLNQLLNQATRHYLEVSGALRLPWQDRDEVTKALTYLQNLEERQVLILTGRAGLGKSGVTARVVEQMQAQEWPTLAFRLDLVQPTDHERKLGESLGLPASPVEALARAAEGRPCLLVIDQLDAVSKASGRQPQFFEVVRRLLTGAQNHPNMRVLMACRDFDLANDDRFKVLVHAEIPVAHELRLAELSTEQVRGVLSDLGFSPDQLSTSQLAILRVPLHLSLFYEGWTERTTPEALAFLSVNDLYHLFTRRKEEQLRETMGDPRFRLSATLAPLVLRMSEEMTLSLPEALADQLGFGTALYSAGILRAQDGRITFFHEGYFDYLFARQFIAERKTLLSVLLEGEQHLFRRAQIRQVLTLLREQDQGHYLQSVRELLTSPAVRFHLKELVFSLLWQWPDPMDEEWELIESLMVSSDPDLAGLARWSVHSFPLSRRLAANGTLARGLESASPEDQQRATSMLNVLLRVEPGAFLAATRPILGRSESLDRRIVEAIGWHLTIESRDFFEFVTELFRRDLLDDHRYWHALEQLSRTRIDWAIEGCALILQTLATRVLKPEEGGEETDRADHFIVDDWPATEIFQRAASENPALFVRQLLPVLLTLAENYASTDQPETRYREDRIWRYRLDFGVDHAPDALLENMIDALSHLETEQFRLYTEQLRASELEVAQYIMLRGYLAHAAECADEVIAALCDEPARLRLYDKGSRTWLGFRLLRAVTPTASAQALQQLEQLLLDFKSHWESSRAGSRTRGLTSYRLLAGIVPERRSQVVRHRIAELARRFPEENPDVLQRTSWGGLVGSPISTEATRRMSDDQWLRAMLKYDSDGMDSHRYTDDGGVTGGASELANVLGEEAKRDPERFARLALQWPDTLNPAYFEHLVMALRDAPLDVSLAVQLAQRCQAIPGRPCGRWLPDLFGQRPELDWPLAALEIVADCALNDPDPVEDTWQRPDGFRGPDAQGINSVRGTAARVIGSLLLARPERFEVFRPVVERLLEDPVVAVRVCAALPVGAMLNVDTELAITWFLRLAETRDEFLTGQHAYGFLEYALHHHFDRVRPLIERMVDAEIDELVRLGAGLATLAAFWHPQAQDLAARVIAGTEAQRAGVAEVLSSAVGNTDEDIVRQCTQGLKVLFGDPDQKVREQAARFAARIESSAFPRHADLLQAFLASPAFKEEPLHLLHQLQKSALRLPDTLLDTAEAYFTDQHQSHHARISRDAHYIREFSQLIFPLYSQHLNRLLQVDGVLTRCLDLFDRMATRRSQEYQDGMQMVER